MSSGLRSVLLGTLRHQSRRYVAAALAVVISVIFIVVTNALSSSARAGYTAGLDVPYRDADVVVSDTTGDEAGELVQRARSHGDAASVLGWTIQPVAAHGRQLHEGVDVGTLADDPDLRWQELTDGRFPEAAGETVADTNQAKAYGVEIGDTLRIGAGTRAVTATVVGLVDSPSASVSSALYLPWDDVAAWADTFRVDSIAYADADSSDPDEIAAALTRAVPDSTVDSVDVFVEERAAALTNQVDVLALMLLIFAALALGVSILVITNTFAILFAQRSREFALVRCVGATRRQLVRAVRTEALVLGSIASALGVALGAAIGYGLVALVRRLFDSAPLGAVDYSVVWLAGAFALGVAVTWAASWLPTRRVARTDPLAALRPVEDTAIQPGGRRLTTVFGAALLVLGIGTLAAAVVGQTAVIMVAGGGLFFVGLLLLGPVLVPALIRGVSLVVGRVQGPAGRLAAANAVRHPKRTAITTASLLIGVTLTSAVLTGLASSRDATNAEMEKQHPVDMTVTATEKALDDRAVADIRATAGVDAADPIPGVQAKVSGVGPLPVVAAAPDLGTLWATDRLPTPGTIGLPIDQYPTADSVTVTANGHTARLKPVPAEGWGPVGLVAPETLAELGEPATAAVWVRATSDADPEDLAGDLSAITGSARGEATLENGLARRDFVDLQFTVMAATVAGLLGIAVVIALVGIANTLGLSVVERGREHALLRALGLTRRQLRRMLATEGLLLSMVATVLGLTVGVAFAWVAVLTLVQPVLDAPLVVPWAQLGAVVLIAALAGALAAVLPARRAARVAPAAGLSLE